jgi:hypothetical protein
MKMISFWDIVPCILVIVDQRFRCVYCLHHQGPDYVITESEKKWNILKMLKECSVTALEEAATSREQCGKENIWMQARGNKMRVETTVQLRAS